jgi:hypothetical protein
MVAKLLKPSAHAVRSPRCIAPAAKQRPRTRLMVLDAHAVSIIPSAQPPHVMLIFRQVLAQRVLVPAIELMLRTPL